eukprot:TRINITY_DN20316_c0_g1_i1.p2 TRINITY_DN20316_c0_g1~~TRINITY_DN20316_c0_g1_i1.p2  ORF type:complete len:139 (+),score=19.77 TRINITY_DN20316_c0_g1_i1:76-492(+)
MGLHLQRRRLQSRAVAEAHRGSILMVARDCVLIGRWRIVESDLWGADDLDLIGPATIAFDDRGHGEITVGVLTASLLLEYASTTVFFRWHGSDDMTEVTGEGSAEFQDDGTIEIELTYHDGDDVILKATRLTPSSTPC